MGREVRMVPIDWNHPKNERGHYKPLLEGYRKDAAEFLEMVNKDGLQEAVEYFGGAPDKNDYMPDFENADHYMMYENTSEGTPISPAFKTPEELARWLADNGASSFGDMTASYDAWLKVIKSGSAPSAVVSGGILMSGVEATEKL